MTLKNIPVEHARLGPVLCVAVTPKTDQDGVQKVDRDGVPTWSVAVAVTPQDGKAGLIEVAVPGEPQGLAPGMYVIFRGLTAFMWEISGRAGMSYRADAVAAGGAPDVPAQPGPAGKSAAGSAK